MVTLHPGARLGAGRYLVREPLGEGGMASVHRVYDTRLEVERAVKVLAPRLATILGLRTRFEAEARTMARLAHPNVVAVHDVGEEDGLLYIVMELLAGGSLADRLAHEGPFAPADAVAILLDVSSAVQAAHDAGVVHRDLKPENVLLGAHGEVKVGDFGIAHLDDPAGGHRLTRTGMPLGTIGFMAPEQRNGTHDQDGRADIFSLGALLYTLLTGTRPGDLFVAELDPSVLHPLPAPFAPVVARATRYRREERYPTANALADALGAALGELGGSAAAPMSAPAARTARVRTPVPVFARTPAPALDTLIPAWASELRDISEVLAPPDDPGPVRVAWAPPAPKDVPEVGPVTLVAEAADALAEGDEPAPASASTSGDPTGAPTPGAPTPGAPTPGAPTPGAPTGWRDLPSMESEALSELAMALGSSPEAEAAPPTPAPAVSVPHFAELAEDMWSADEIVRPPAPPEPAPSPPEGFPLVAVARARAAGRGWNAGGPEGASWRGARGRGARAAVVAAVVVALIAGGALLSRRTGAHAADAGAPVVGAAASGAAVSTPPPIAKRALGSIGPAATVLAVPAPEAPRTPDLWPPLGFGLTWIGGAGHAAIEEPPAHLGPGPAEADTAARCAPGDAWAGQAAGRPFRMKLLAVKGSAVTAEAHVSTAKRVRTLALTGTCEGGALRVAERFVEGVRLDLQLSDDAASGRLTQGKGGSDVRLSRER